MGSSPIAHTAAENATPHTQGMWGITEIFIDTFVVTTLTGILLLCAGTTDIGGLFTVCFGKRENRCSQYCLPYSLTPP
jgi:Na+/alanine symporter